ncbi:hypothetical protein HMSSN036_06950 [Paenibacillus macerans]|nr:hypothetical protein HMSSN036_06950 [Paenibacillus macerans]
MWLGDTAVHQKVRGFNMFVPLAVPELTSLISRVPSAFMFSGWSNWIVHVPLTAAFSKFTVSRESSRKNKPWKRR